MEESSNNEGDTALTVTPLPAANGHNSNPAHSLSIFATLDAPFIHFDRRVEPILWQGKNILVQQVN